MVDDNHPLSWRPIETAPLDEDFLGAVQVSHTSGFGWWEMHVISIDSETRAIEHSTDAGWQAGDYSHWMPLPPPPTSEAQS